MRYTIRKYRGNDLYSWAVFKNGRPIMTGLSRQEAIYLRDEKNKTLP